ncbi:conserved Plasmodium protein, unknown function [Plasmodium vinckei lentum]|uniref:WW domain-containing protein n=1 Tax=Plasmodium vinckei lentum TaxID=138297 RepID=A0A6V7S562_PLAVN|nr:conserved Plasmodium protein, unknown function [Plasmodium vinckei lentum]
METGVNVSNDDTKITEGEKKNIDNNVDNVISNEDDIKLSDSSVIEDPKKISKEVQEYFVGVPESWEYVEKSKGWFIIETSKNYKFYFNKRTQEKTWKCPKEVEELLNKQNLNDDIENGNNYEQAENSEFQNEISRDKENKNKADEEMEKIINGYKSLLIEKEINEFSKYESVLGNILYDNRFMKVPKDLRKDYFYKLIKEIKEDKKNELKMLIENFQSLLKKFENKLENLYDHKEDIIKLLKGKTEYEGNHTKQWKNTRSKLLDNYLDKLIKEKETKLEQEFEQDLWDFLQTESAGVWFKIKNTLMKNKKYELISYEKKNKLFDIISKKILENRKHNKSQTNRKYNSNQFERHDKNQKNLFTVFLHERLKYPDVEKSLEYFLKHKYLEDKKFDEIGLISNDILNSENYKQIFLSDKEKYMIYKDFINNYINLKRERFDKLISQLSINLIDKSLEQIIQIVDENNKIFKAIKPKHLEHIYINWKKKNIHEAKKIFKDFIIKSNYIKHDSDQSDKYTKLLTQLSEDVSYRRLDCVPDEREQIIKDRIKEMKKEHEKNKNIAEKLNF